ncbi:MAG: MBL fold metallo-hydrolase [Anaerolineae bacterium]|nr:MBL fold metallo-hydrolase [Anaerolineae bacterium]
MSRFLAVCIIGFLVAGCVAQPTPTMIERPVTPAQATMPTFTPTSEPAPTLLSTAEDHTIEFTIVYDNNAYNPTLRTDWGFSCWIEAGETTVLFDTGGDSATLLGNLARLGLDPQTIDLVVLSHAHDDHTGGLAGLLDMGIKPVVYVPAAFSESFKADVRARTELVEITEPTEIAPGVYTTGQMGHGIVEQALIVQAGAGWIVVTGCAHPGVAAMVRRAKEVIGGEIVLVMGGFHLGSADKQQIESLVAEFRQMGVQRVAPCHCTGDQARQMFAQAYGVDCTLAGAGWIFHID